MGGTSASGHTEVIGSRLDFRMATIKGRGSGFQILPHRWCTTKILGRRETYELTLWPLRPRPGDAVQGTRVHGRSEELRRQQSPGRAQERVMEDWRPKGHMCIPHRPLAKLWTMHVHGKTTKAFQTVAATGLRVTWRQPRASSAGKHCNFSPAWAKRPFSHCRHSAEKSEMPLLRDKYTVLDSGLL